MCIRDRCCIGLTRRLVQSSLQRHHIIIIIIITIIVTLLSSVIVYTIPHTKASLFKTNPSLPSITTLLATQNAYSHLHQIHCPPHRPLHRSSSSMLKRSWSPVSFPAPLHIHSVESLQCSVLTYPPTHRAPSTAPASSKTTKTSPRTSA